MPQASELEEFGLEVEHEHYEHDSLIAGSPSHRSNSLSLTPLSISTPSSNNEQSKFPLPHRFASRPGMLKWATLVLALVIVVFLHLGQESEETTSVEATLPEVAICEDDPEFTILVKSEKSCATFVQHVGKHPLLDTRCNMPIGIPDENQFQKLLKHFCRRSCGLCGMEDAEGGVGQSVIDAEVKEIAEEIEEKEEFEQKMKDEIDDEETKMNLSKNEKEEQNLDQDEQGDTVSKGTTGSGEEIINRSNASGDVKKSESAAASVDGKNEEEGGQLDQEVVEEDTGTKSAGEIEKQGVSSDDKKQTAIASDDEKQTVDQVVEGDTGTKSTGEEGKQGVSSDDKKQTDVVASDDKKQTIDQVVQDDDDDDDDDDNVGDMGTKSAGEGGSDDKKQTAAVASDDKKQNAAEGGGDAGETKIIDNNSDSANDSADTKADMPSTKANNGTNASIQEKTVKVGGTFTLQRLEDTRTAAQTLVDSLENYYNGADQSKRMLLDAWLDPWVFDKPDGAARERTDKLADTMARALVTDDQNEFIIGTIGSSVAAGHDNCHYDSYESQLERTFGPVWEAAGMKFFNQNAGEGGSCGDDYKNQAFCIKQNVSPNVDVVHYTWTYFEEGDSSDKYAIRESLIRWTQMLPHQPPVNVLNFLYLPDTNRAKQEYELALHYAKFGYNAFYMRSGHKNGGYDYDADKKKDIDRYAWGFVGDGYHNVTRYGQNEADPDRKESLGVVMRNWHPGPLAFEFVSDTFAYVYAKAMLVALDLIEEFMKKGLDPREVWSASKRKIFLKKNLPEPKFCEQMYCVVDEAPGCLNYEKPTYGFWGARVEDPNDSLNPHKGELQNWEVWHEENDLWRMVGKQDTAIFQNREDKEKELCRHLDQCGGISASSPDNGSVVFRLPKMEVGLVVICGCCGKDVAQEMFMQNNYIEIKYNGAVLNRAEWDVFPNGKCVRLLKKFPTEGEAAMTPTGHAYLAIKALQGLWKPVRISHVITL